jgi:hypothetical protein
MMTPEALIALFYVDEGDGLGGARLWRCRVCEKGSTTGGSFPSWPQHHMPCPVEELRQYLAAAGPPPSQDAEQYFEISHHELSRFHNENFIWDCFKRFTELVPCPRGFLGDNLVMMWRQDYDKRAASPPALLREQVEVFKKSMTEHHQTSIDRDAPMTQQEFSRGAAFAYARVVLELEKAALCADPPKPKIGESLGLSENILVVPSTLSGNCGCDGPTRIDPNCKYHGADPPKENKA